MRFLKIFVFVVLLTAHFGPWPAGADHIAYFTTPATASGIRGGQGLPVYQGFAHPRSRDNFTTSAVFIEPDLSNNVIMIATTGDKTRDPVTRLEVPGSDTREILFGRSTDGGATFYFRRVLQWTNGMRVVRIAMVPDPVRLRVWTGIAQVVYNEPDSPDENFRGTTRIEIDLPLNTVRLLKTGATFNADGSCQGSNSCWNEYSFGFVNAPEPGYIKDPVTNASPRLTHIAQVTVGGATRYEAWGTEAVSPGPQQLCPNDPQFLENTAQWAQKGVRIVWYRFQTGTPRGLDLSSKKYIASSVRSLPTDNPRSDGFVARGELGTEEFLFVGTQDQTVCEEVIGPNSDGSSVRFIGLSYNPTTDNYTEIEHKFLLSLASPTLPNWTCADSSVLCKSGSRLNFSFIGVIPYQNGSTMRLYTNIWGGFFPSLPVIGEAGTVQVNHEPKVVNLSRTYREPVVFVQPASYVGGRSVVARVTAVSSNSFSVRVQEDSSQDDVHNLETLSYVVLERGTYRLLDRRVLEVDKLVTSQALPSTATWTSKLDLLDSFEDPTGAIVLTQLQTANDSYFAKTRQTGAPSYLNVSHCNPINQCGLVYNAQVAFGIENDEAAPSKEHQHGSETVGILLLGETWLGRRSSIYHLGPSGASGFDVGRRNVSAGATGVSWTSITFEAPHLGDLTNPVLLAWPESRLDPEPVGLRYRSLSSAGVELTLDEDQSLDTERTHGLESVVYWVIGKGSSLIRAQPITLNADHMF